LWAPGMAVREGLDSPGGTIGYEPHGQKFSKV